jgi:hypothetical protein
MARARKHGRLAFIGAQRPARRGTHAKDTWRWRPCLPWTLLRRAGMGQNGSAAGLDGDGCRAFGLGPVR